MPGTGNGRCTAVNEPTLPLGPLESRIMRVLWVRGPASIREVIDELGAEYAYTTIATVLTHLEGKTLVTRSREGRNVRFSATISGQEHCALTMQATLASGGDRAGVIECFVNQLDDSDLELIYSILERRRVSKS